uniref:ShKT domain-containing protein n=1 Tax=Panagrolaimus sp. PS1159 TaxID=55785 RepID=A0AC35GSB8_9BILA
MLALKSFFALFLIASFGAKFGAAENCTKDDYLKIYTCYVEANNGAEPFLTDLVAPMFTMNATKAYWKPICENKKKLDNCIGKERIQNCFNVEGIKHLPFSPIESAAKIVITGFLEIDHNCDRLLKFSDKNIECLGSLAKTVPKMCESKTFECVEIEKAVNCTIDAAYKLCGNVVGCFNLKTTTLQKCYLNIICENCGEISVANNPITGLCNDDEENVNVKTTTTAVPASSDEPLQTTITDVAAAASSNETTIP